MIDLKLFRRDNKLTQLKLAELIGCDQSFISSVEAGRRPIPEAIITKLLSLNDLNKRYLKNDNNQANNITSCDNISMPREVFDIINKMSDTILSQQKTIESLSNKGKVIAQMEDDAGCADADDLRLAK